MAASRAASPARRSRWLRWTVRLVQGLAVLALVSQCLVVWLLWSLDQPWMRRRVRGLAETAARLDVDYGRTQITRHGLRITDLVVRTPAHFRDLAPELVHLDVLEVQWSLRGLLRAGVTAVALRGLTVTLVLDADDRTSISELSRELSAGAGVGKPAGQRTPPSRLAAALLGGAPPFAHATIEGIAVTLLIRDEHRAVERLHATGLGLVLDTAAAGAGWQLHATAGVPAAPRILTVQREHQGRKTGDATADLQLAVSVSPTQAQASLELRVEHQTLWPMIQVDHLIHAAAQARFDRPGGGIELVLQEVALADGAAHLEARVELADALGAVPVLQLGRGTVDLQPVFGPLLPNLLPVSARRAVLHFAGGPLILSRVPRLAEGGHAEVDGDFDDLRLRLGGAVLMLGRGQLAVQVASTAEQGMTLQAKVPLQGLRFTQSAAELSAATVQLTASGHIDRDGAVTGEAALQLGTVLRTAGVPVGKPGAPALRIALGAGHLVVHATELRLRPAATTPPPAVAQAPPAAQVAPPATQPEPGHEPGLVRGLAHGLARGLAHAPGQPGQAVHAGAEPHPKRAVHARLTLSGQLDGIDVQLSTLHAVVDSLGIEAQGQLTGAAPYALEVDLPVRGLRLADGKGLALLSGPAHLSVHLSEIYPDLADWRRTRGALKLAAELGATHAQLVVHKHPEALDFDVLADASSLTDVRPFVAIPGSELPWQSMVLALHSEGKVERLWAADPQLSQHAELRLEHPAWKSATGSVAAQGLLLAATTTGTTRHHSVELDLRLRGPVVSGEKLEDLHLTLDGAADADASTLRLHLGSESPTGPKATVAVALGFDRINKVLAYDLALHTAKLAPLQPFLNKLPAARGFDLSALELSLGGRGTVVGVVDSIGPGGGLHFAPHPLATAGITGTLELGAAGLYWGDGDRVVKSPRLGWRATLKHDGAGQKVHGELLLDALHVEFGEHELDFSKVHDALDLTIHGDPALGEVELTQTLKLDELEQDLASGYTLSGLTLRLQAARNHDGEVIISELKLANPGGGTELDLTGHLELHAGRRSLSLSGTLDQQLDRLWSDHDVYLGRGALALVVNVDSGNFTRFHTRAAVRISDGSLTLPRRGIAIEGFVGEVPIIADLLLDHSGLQMLPGTPASVYAQLRYADQHPLLSGRSFISVGRIATPWFTASGLAGNLRIQHSVVSLNQFELGTRGGHVSGLCLLDFSDGDPTVQLRVRASRIEASHGERFDGNAAVVIGVHDRSVEGRGEILRIGRRHLLDLLDLHDPQRADPAVNRIREALRIGYPERLSLAFDHGFATARIILGGLAGMFRIDPLRGIPMGPIIDNLLQKGSVNAEEEP